MMAQELIDPPVLQEPRTHALPVTRPRFRIPTADLRDSIVVSVVSFTASGEHDRAGRSLDEPE
jgi:hypothetical protein